VKKDPQIHIIFVLECIQLIEEYVKDATLESFTSSPQLQDAVIRRIELIGEAVKNVPDHLKQKYPEIQWNRITGMRNILIHDYLGIDLKTTWQVTKREIPELKMKMLEIKRKLQDEGVQRG
jgi:uncharacterized protein with HEPN domain